MMGKVIQFSWIEGNEKEKKIQKGFTKNKPTNIKVSMKACRKGMFSERDKLEMSPQNKKIRFGLFAKCHSTFMIYVKGETEYFQSVIKM